MKQTTPYVKKKVADQTPFLFSDCPPHESSINNLKSKKFFESTEPVDMKEALKKYRTKMLNKSSSNSSTLITNSPNKMRNSMIIDKDLVQYAEPRSTPKISYKIKPKNFDENVETDSDDDLNENCAVYNKNKSIGHLTFTKSSKTLTNESFVTKKERLNTTDIEQVDIKIEKMINYEVLMFVEYLYLDLIKDIEINKMDIYENKISIIDDFLDFYFNKENYSELFTLFDCGNEYNKNSIQKVCKDFFIQQLIFLYILKIIGKIKNEKDSYLSGIKNVIFYFHQNYIAFLFILVTKSEDIVKTIEPNEENKKNLDCYEKCKKKINDSKTWLTKSNYKKCLVSNNKITKGIIKNTLNQMHLYFKEDSQSKSKDIESMLTYFGLFIKSINKTRLETVISNLQTNTTLKNVFESSNAQPKDTVKAPVAPFLPPKENSSIVYTLVLDLDETLIHYIEDNDTAYVNVRPGAEEFIEELSKYYEIVIFTAALQKYADVVLEGLDKNNCISYRLYREHTVCVNKVNVKDLNKLGRDITKVIIVDNYPENFSLQPKNGLHIKNFEGEEDDCELDPLKEDLIQLIKDNPQDVRDYLGSIQERMDQRAAEEENNLNEDNALKIVDSEEKETENVKEESEDEK